MPRGRIAITRLSLLLCALAAVFTAFSLGTIRGGHTRRGQYALITEKQYQPYIQEALELAVLININTADAILLTDLPGIGPVLAQRIIDYRLEYGEFSVVEGLLEVKGIGEKTLEKLRPYITVIERMEPTT